MTKEEVKASESEKLLKEVKFDEKEVVSYGFDEVIIYVGEMASTNVQIHYTFLNDHLIHAAYLLVEQYEDKTLYITAFDRLREALTYILKPKLSGFVAATLRLRNLRGPIKW